MMTIAKKSNRQRGAYLRYILYNIETISNGRTSHKNNFACAQSIIICTFAAAAIVYADKTNNIIYFRLADEPNPHVVFGGS